MNAMQLMLKQLGLDPEVLKQNAEQIGTLVGQIAEKLNAIEAQNARIEQKLDALLADPSAPPKTALEIQPQQRG